MVNILPKTIEKCLILFFESTFEPFFCFLKATNGWLRTHSRQELLYSAGKSGAKGRSGGPKNFKVQV